jgi:F420 biosynthesis protein FbiB-like protein
MNVLEAIQGRRSIRKFKEQPVPESALRQVLEAAICAPSGSNRQPWRFQIITDPSTRDRLVACTQEAIAGVTEDVQPGFAADFSGYSQHFQNFGQAPAVIVVLQKIEPMLVSLFKEGTRSQELMQALELKSSVMSVSMAVQNMLLAATELGLGTCVMTGPLIAADAFARILSVPEGWELLCLVSVGYPDEKPQPLRKKIVDHVVLPPPSGDSHGI